MNVVVKYKYAKRLSNHDLNMEKGTHFYAEKKILFLHIWRDDETQMSKVVMKYVPSYHQQIYLHNITLWCVFIHENVSSNTLTVWKWFKIQLNKYFRLFDIPHDIWCFIGVLFEFFVIYTNLSVTISNS